MAPKFVLGQFKNVKQPSLGHGADRGFLHRIVNSLLVVAAAFAIAGLAAPADPGDRSAGNAEVKSNANPAVESAKRFNHQVREDFSQVSWAIRQPWNGR